jgi:exodeoxyribonuclease V alpha subunit
VIAGEAFEASGHWQSSRDYGRQFKADSLKLERPDSPEGIERYLGSGLVEGIGPAYAKRLVARFGAGIFEIIEHESARLEEVEGIGRKRRQEIRASWLKQRAVHAIMLFLHAHGVSSARALRIYKTYGDDALSVLQANPYRLAQDIHGIGFKTADQIARQLGLAADAPERVRAALLHSLAAAAGNGHTCLPATEALDQARELIGVEAAAVREALAFLTGTGDLVQAVQDGVAKLWLPALHTAEIQIARHLRELIALPPDWPRIDLEPALAAIAERTGKPLAPSQVEAVREVLRRRVLILTGGPGVGKTTLVNTLLELLGDREIVLAAPTGRAARRLAESTGREAKTLHRLLEAQGGGTWGRHRGRPLEGQVFVCDEASMIDTPLMARFLAALPAEAHLLLVGDADQLPSVGPGRVLGDLLACGTVPAVRLTEIFRQAAASRIITSAHAINAGRLPDLKPARDSDFFFLEEMDPETLRTTLVELARTRLPAKYGFDPVADLQVLTPMNRGPLGTRALNEALQAALNPPNETKFELERFGVTFRVGDKVIQTNNNYDKDVFNGDIGHIDAIDTEPLRIGVRFDGGRRVEYEPGELDELQLAYALSIHKSQGSEFPCVLLPVSRQHAIMLERSLIYTGLTRAKKLAVLLGDPAALEMAVRRQSSRRRWTGLATGLGIA